MRPATEPHSEIVLFAGNLPGQVRGPKADLLPHPERTNYAIRLLRGCAVGRPWAIGIAEFSSRSLPAWRSHLRVTLSRAAANDVVGKVTIGNAVAFSELRCVDAKGLHFRVPRKLRRITMPVRLLVDEDGAAFVLIAAHIPTSRRKRKMPSGVSEKTRRRLCDELERYAARCFDHGRGFPVAVVGDFNGAQLSMRVAALADVQRIYTAGMGVKAKGKLGDAAGKVTDHSGIAFAVVQVPVAPKGRALVLPEVGVRL